MDVWNLMIRERVEPHNLSSLCLGLRRSISISLKSVDRSAFLISLGGEDGRIKCCFISGRLCSCCSLTMYLHRRRGNK